MELSEKPFQSDICEVLPPRSIAHAPHNRIKTNLLFAFVLFAVLCFLPGLSAPPQLHVCESFHCLFFQLPPHFLCCLCCRIRNFPFVCRRKAFFSTHKSTQKLLRTKRSPTHAHVSLCCLHASVEKKAKNSPYNITFYFLYRLSGLHNAKHNSHSIEGSFF